jgi:integrase
VGGPGQREYAGAGPRGEKYRCPPLGLFYAKRGLVRIGRKDGKSTVLRPKPRDDGLEALYVLALSTDMRQRELLALEWEDVDLEGGRLPKRAGLPPIGFHDLRHVVALEERQPEGRLREPGHPFVSVILDIYSDLLPEMQEKAVAALEELLS